MGVQILVTVPVARDVAVAPRERDKSRCIIRMAVIVASRVRKTRNTAAPSVPIAEPAAPSGLGRNSQ